MAHASKCTSLVLALVSGAFACGGGKSAPDAAAGHTGGGAGLGTGGGGTGVDAPVAGAGGGLGGGGWAGTLALGTGGAGGGPSGTGTGGGSAPLSVRGAGGLDAGDAGAGRIGAGGMGTGGVGSGGRTSGGTGGAPAEAWLELDRSRMDFGYVTPGTTSVATFTLSNRGSSPSGVPSISIELQRSPGAGGNPVAVTGCGAALPAGTSCALTISVTPPALGLFEAFVHVSANPGTKAPSSRLPIYVVGWAIGFGISSPTRVDFGDLAPGSVVKHSFTVTATTNISDLQVWKSGDELSIDASGTTCTTTLVEGASCVVTVTFVASTLGWKETMVGVRAGGDSGQVANIELTANVTKASDLAIEPKAPPSFLCVIEQTSAPVVFTVTNLSSSASGTISVAIVGDSARDFAVSQADCTVLAPHGTCTVAVVCDVGMSASAETRHAVLSVTDGNTNLSVALSGQVSFDF